VIVASEAPPPEPAEALPLAPAEAQSRTPSGSLRIFAVRRAGRTVVETLRQEGLARCSRPLPDSSRSGATRLVVSQLGPGFVRGDRFTTDGELGPGGQLTVAAQAAARVLGEGAASEALTTWRLGAGARLFMAGEPTMLYAGATNRSYSTVTLGAGASLAWIDAIAPYGAFERATTQLRVFYGDRLAVHDRLVLTPARLPAALGSAYYLRDGLSPERQARAAGHGGRVRRARLRRGAAADRRRESRGRRHRAAGRRSSPKTTTG
jgi:hypothetical protein